MCILEKLNVFLTCGGPTAFLTSHLEKGVLLPPIPTMVIGMCLQRN